MSNMKRALFVAINILFITSCSTVSTPPSMSNYRTEIDKQKGETSVSGSYQGASGGILTGRSFDGGAVQLSHQLTKNLQVGGTAQARLSHRTETTENKGTPNEYRVNIPKYALSGKGFVRYDIPEASWIDLSAGLGAGYTETNLISGTADAGITIGPEKTLTSLNLFKPYVGYFGALSVPLDRGEPLVRETNYPLNDDQYASTTLYHGAVGGLGLKIAENGLLFADIKMGESAAFGSGAPTDERARDYKTGDFFNQLQVGIEYAF